MSNSTTPASQMYRITYQSSASEFKTVVIVALSEQDAQHEFYATYARGMVVKIEKA